MILQHAGIRRKLSLGTWNKVAAAVRARDTYRAVVANGWEATLKELRPKKGPPANLPDVVTVGRFLQELKAVADLKPETFKGYAIAFRSIVEDIFNIQGGREKFDAKGGGHARWLARINAVKLADITPARVQEWKKAFIARAGNDPVKQRSARTSFNSYLRRAKSLFAPGALKHLSVKLPSPLPFDGIAFESRQAGRYRSSIDPAKLIRSAQQELSQDDPPVFLAFLLALGAGLRRGEIDTLEWSAFQWSKNVIRIETTRYFTPKTEHSAGDVQVDPELMSVFRQHHAQICASSQNGVTPGFVIEGASQPIPGDNYRAGGVFERLSAWLRAHGVTARKPIHELRKEFGSLINRRHGLTAARDQLRHGDIGVTAEYYVDHAREATSGLGALLLEDKIIEFRVDQRKVS